MQTSTLFEEKPLNPSPAANQMEFESNIKSVNHSQVEMSYNELAIDDYDFMRTNQPHVIMLMQAEQRNRYQMKG